MLCRTESRKLAKSHELSSLSLSSKSRVERLQPQHTDKYLPLFFIEIDTLHEAATTSKPDSTRLATRNRQTSRTFNKMLGQFDRHHEHTLGSLRLSLYASGAIRRVRNQRSKSQSDFSERLRLQLSDRQPDSCVRAIAGLQTNRGELLGARY